MQLDEWREAGNYFRYGSHTVFYREEGRGETLVCIHGFPTASWDWHYIWPNLIKRFRVIAPDMLGFGFSDKPTEDVYTIDYQATLHETLLKCLEVNRIHILAHDYGATITQEMLARYEERKKKNQSGLEIQSICFLNGGLFPEVHQPRFIQKLLISPLGPLIGRFISEESFGKNFSAVCGKNTKPTERVLKDYWNLNSYNDGFRASPKLMRYLDERKKFRERWVGAMINTRVPMRFINGPEDPGAGRNMVDRYREVIPKPDVVLLDGIGHFPQMEDPDGVLRAFTGFIEHLATRIY